MSLISYPFKCRTFTRSEFRHHCDCIYVLPSAGTLAMTSHERHIVSNQRSFDCLFSILCGPTSKKHQSPLYWGPCVCVWEENPPVTGEFPHKGPVTQKKLPFDDVMMEWIIDMLLPYLWWTMVPYHSHGLDYFIQNGWRNLEKISQQFECLWEYVSTSKG